MVKPTNGDINPSASQTQSASESTHNLTSIATQAASKALSGSSESPHVDELNGYQDSFEFSFAANFPERDRIGNSTFGNCDGPCTRNLES